MSSEEGSPMPMETQNTSPTVQTTNELGRLVVDTNQVDIDAELARVPDIEDEDRVQMYKFSVS